MYVIVGLGNPEQKYEGTRHNIGFSAITALADEYNISVDTAKHRALIGKGVIEGQKVILAKPLTYMNLSGESVRDLADYYKIIPEEQLIVVYDDINLAVGKLRIRAGEKPPGWDLADHVLSRFPCDEEPLVREALQDAAAACKVIMAQDINAAMNQFN